MPGSGKHAKRWEDVMDILAAGIDVVTTVNIQHLESIADEVEHMTGARVRERVPDWVVRKADQMLYEAKRGGRNTVRVSYPQK